MDKHKILSVGILMLIIGFVAGLLAARPLFRSGEGNQAASVFDTSVLNLNTAAEAPAVAPARQPVELQAVVDAADKDKVQVTLPDRFDAAGQQISLTIRLSEGGVVSADVPATPKEISSDPNKPMPTPSVSYETLDIKMTDLQIGDVVRFSTIDDVSQGGSVGTSAIVWIAHIVDKGGNGRPPTVTTANRFSVGSAPAAPAVSTPPAVPGTPAPLGEPPTTAQ